MVYYNGTPMLFSIGEYQPSEILKGMLNAAKLQEVYESTLSAIEMNAREIILKF